LAHQILILVESQPVYGGTTLTGAGSQRGDFLMATAAQAKFTVLVEIKKPNTPLLGKTYRNHAYLFGEELVGGIAQIQGNCLTWALEGARQFDNLRARDEEQIYTLQPKGILIVGNTSQLLRDAKMRTTFELLRRELRNPEILTFDELLERAKFLVAIDRDLLRQEHALP
jgi:hypothetical protein